MVFIHFEVDDERGNASLLRKNLKFTKERYHSTENMWGKFHGFVLKYCSEVLILYLLLLTPTAQSLDVVLVC